MFVLCCTLILRFFSLHKPSPSIQNANNLRFCFSLSSLSPRCLVFISWDGMARKNISSCKFLRVS
ncbi:hypothetical protein Chor_016536 [Crotalus horridus]